MINEEIMNIAKEAKKMLKKQKEQANQALNNLPDGETKEKLRELMKQGAKGKVNMTQAQEALTKILSDASTD